jgi:hypothetical protein
MKVSLARGILVIRTIRLKTEFQLMTAISYVKLSAPFASTMTDRNDGRTMGVHTTHPHHHYEGVASLVDVLCWE